MTETARGIVLHTTRYTDHSVIADVYTDTRGTLGMMVRMPGGKRSPLRAALLSPLPLVEVGYDWRGGGNSLVTPRYIRLTDPYASISYHPVKGAIALFLGDFMRHALRHEQGSEQLLDFVRASMLWLDGAEGRVANFPLAFMIRMSRLLGFWPTTDEMREVLTPDELPALRQMLRMSYANMHLYRMSGPQRARATQAAVDYYRMHIPNFPQLKSLDILHQVMA